MTVTLKHTPVYFVSSLFDSLANVKSSPHISETTYEQKSNDLEVNQLMNLFHTITVTKTLHGVS